MYSTCVWWWFLDGAFRADFFGCSKDFALFNFFLLWSSKWCEYKAVQNYPWFSFEYWQQTKISNEHFTTLAVFCPFCSHSGTHTNGLNVNNNNITKAQWLATIPPSSASHKGVHFVWRGSFRRKWSDIGTVNITLEREELAVLRANTR